MRQSWASEVIDNLAVLKRAGYTFEESWATTLRAIPPRGREFGQAVQSFELLTADEDDGIEPFADFMRRVCSDAWHGARPALKFLDADLAGGFVTDDQSGFAVKNGRMTNRAAA